MSNRRKSNSLAVLAADIRAAHEDVARSSKLTAERAVDAGRLLSEAKARDDIPRGGWDRWVEQETGIPKTTAYYYLRLFVAVKEGRSTLNDIAEAGQIGALKAAAVNQADEEDDDDSPTPGPVSPDEAERIADAEAGRCVVANMHDGTDVALLMWAQANDRFVRIDRRTEWGNPFEMPDDGERQDVVGKFSRFYFPYKDGLLARIPTLRGKVLGCWCHPEECHGHIIAEIVNAEAEGKGSATELADQLAEVDG
jgi:hypothetical protein